MQLVFLVSFVKKNKTILVCYVSITPFFLNHVHVETEPLSVQFRVATLPNRIEERIQTKKQEEHANSTQKGLKTGTQTHNLLVETKQVNKYVAARDKLQESELFKILVGLKICTCSACVCGVQQSDKQNRKKISQKHKTRRPEEAKISPCSAFLGMFEDFKSQKLNHVQEF